MGPARPSRLLRVRPTALLAIALLVAGYTVEYGDTLSEIAERFDVSSGQLADANDLDDPDRLIAGTRLTVPQAEPAAPQAGPGADGAPAADPLVPASRGEVGALIERTARAHGWSPAFVKALAWQESGWKQDRVSSAGAIGIMQVMPATGEFISAHLARRPLDLDDPADNVLAGVLFLDYLYGLTGGDAEQTLAGYYQGLASAREHGRFPSTDRYIDNVLALRARFR